MSRTKWTYEEGIVLLEETSSTATKGAISTKTGDENLHVYLDGADRSVVTENQSQTLSNKSIDADNNPISNLEVDNLKSGVLNTSTTLAGASNTQLPSALAVKTYVDDKTAAQNEASEISYDNAVSGLSATNVQDAIDEVDFNLNATQTILADHIADTTNAHDASAISNVPAGTISSTDVQSAINELDGDIQAHINDTTDAHDASAISTTPISGVTGTDVQAVLANLKAQIDAGGNGDVSGPASATDNAIARFDLTTGKLIQNSTVTLSDTGVIVGITIDGGANTLTNIPNSSLANGIDASKIANGSVSNTEFQYLDGVTSSIQSQLDVKVDEVGGTIITPARLDMKQDTLANLTTYALTATNGQFVFSTDTKETFVVKDGQLASVGSAGGLGINYIINYNAETNTNGWSTYADAAGTSPVDGTGGSPTVTYTRTTSSPLRNTASFLYTKPASNVQGQGFSYDFTIDSADCGKVLQGSFEYQIASGTFADNDMSVWIYDITNSRLIQPAPYLLKNSTIIEKFPIEFQTAINSTSYRLIIHQTSTSASAYTIKFDTFNFGPQAKLYGSAITDPVTKTFTLTNAGNATVVGTVSQLGSKAIFKGRIQIGSSLPTGNIILNLPAGYTLANIGTFLQSTISGAGTTDPIGMALAESATSISFWGPNTSSRWNATVPITWSNGNFIDFNIIADIVGWTSSQVMSSDASTRVVAARYSFSGTQSFPDNVATVAVWNSLANGGFDTHRAMNTSNGRYTFPTPGQYAISASLGVTASIGIVAGNRLAIYYRINGGTVKQVNFNIYTGTTTESPAINGSDIVTVNAGDYIEILGQFDFGVASYNVASSGGGTTFFSIFKISGPSQIMASETVAALYTGAPPTGTLGASSNLVTYGTKVKDSHNAYNNGLFTAPISGCYDISASLRYASTFTAIGQIAACIIAIDGIDKYQGYWYAYTAANTAAPTSLNIKSVPLLAGQTISVRSYIQGNSPSFASDGTTNFISISRSGNY